MIETFGRWHPDSVNILYTIASRRALRESRKEATCYAEFIGRLSVMLQRGNYQIILAEVPVDSIADPAMRVDTRAH